MKTMLGIAAGILIVAGSCPAAAQNAPVLSVDESLICAGLFFAQSKLPESAEIPGAVAAYEEVSAVFLERAQILARRQGQPTDDHIDRAATVAMQMTAMVDARTGKDQRLEVIVSWAELENMCIAGANAPV